MTRTALALAIAAALAGCQHNRDRPLADAVESGRVKPGSAYADVIEAVGREPNTSDDYFQQLSTPDGRKVIWTPGGKFGRWPTQYKFTIVNDRVTDVQRVQ